MKILVDTNVILDVLFKRVPFYFDSAKVWTSVNEELTEGYISAISVNNLFYIVKRLKTSDLAGEFVDQLLSDFNVIELTKDILKQARTIPDLDYEDLIQYFSAVHQGCDVLVTRNKKDFPAIGLKILTPKEFIDLISKD